MSRTRGRGSSVSVSTEEVESRQNHNDNESVKCDNSSPKVGKRRTENTIAVEMVKALPVLTPSAKSGNSAMNIEVNGMAGNPGVTKLEGEDVMLSSPLHQMIGPSGELLDHYVVHLTEAVDGSASTIQVFVFTN